MDSSLIYKYKENLTINIKYCVVHLGETVCSLYLSMRLCGGVCNVKYIECVWDITPYKNHNTATKNLGLKGEPNSSVDILDDAGNIKTRRWFGENGDQI